MIENELYSSVFMIESIMWVSCFLSAIILYAFLTQFRKKDRKQTNFKAEVLVSFFIL